MHELACGYTVLACGYTVLACGYTVLACGYTVLACGYTVLACGYTVLAYYVGMRLVYHLLKGRSTLDKRTRDVWMVIIDCSPC
jgi:hypothetical protein